jgi:GTP cyclohydrolase II
MTNNPRKVEALEKHGVSVVERIPLVVNRNPFNTGYLNTKASKLGHWISEGGDQPDLEAAQSDGAADSAPTMQS